MTTMKAAICNRYGPPENVTLADLPRPVPGDDEVLIRTRATTVNSGDARVRGANFPAGTDIPARLSMGLFGPRMKVLGFEVAGEVEAVGRNVTRLQPGDSVLASRGFKFGCHAEYVLIGPKDVAVLIPEDLTYEDAAALEFGGITSLRFFDEAGLTAGESVLINGASGAVGVMAVQIAKHAGAHVTAVCSDRNAELMRELGADAVIDYAATDIFALTERFDVIMDTHGNAPYKRVKHMLRPGGRFLLVYGTLWEMISAKSQKAVVTADDESAAFSPGIFDRLLAMAARGEIRPVISKSLAFEQIVEAHRIVDTGHKVGSVVLTLP